MTGKYIAFAAVVCFFAVLIVPSEDKAGEAVTSSEAADLVESPAATRSNSFNSNTNSGWFSGDHTLDREADGHFYADTYVDGAPVRMMVDTGATVIALTGADARAAGLYWDSSEVRHIGSGASGAVYGVPVTLGDVEIGGMSRRNVDAVIIPEGLGISLLGQSYLSQFNSVEINGDQMVMSGN